MLTTSIRLRPLLNYGTYYYNALITKVTSFALRILLTALTIPVLYIGIAELRRAKPDWVVHNAYQQFMPYILSAYLVGLKEIWGKYQTIEIESMSMRELKAISARSLSEKHIAIAFSKPERIMAASKEELRLLLGLRSISINYIMKFISDKQVLQIVEILRDMTAPKRNHILGLLFLNNACRLIAKLETYKDKTTWLRSTPAAARSSSLFEPLLPDFSETAIDKFIATGILQNNIPPQVMFSWLDREIAIERLYNRRICTELGLSYLLSLLKNSKGSDWHKDTWYSLQAYITSNARPSELLEAVDGKYLSRWLESLPYHSIENFLSLLGPDQKLDLQFSIYLMTLVPHLVANQINQVFNPRFDQTSSTLLKVIPRIPSDLIQQITNSMGIHHSVFAFLSREQLKNLDLKTAIFQADNLRQSGTSVINFTSWLKHLFQPSLIIWERQNYIVKFARNNFKWLSEAQRLYVYATMRHDFFLDEKVLFEHDPQLATYERMTDLYLKLGLPFTASLKDIQFQHSTCRDLSKKGLYNEIISFLTNRPASEKAKPSNPSIDKRQPTPQELIANYCETLGLEPSCTTAMVKKKFYQLAREYHPDRAEGVAQQTEYEEKFKTLNNAYEGLMKLKGN